MTNFDRVATWLKAYNKTPSIETFSLQAGCHIEEFIEFLESVEFKDDNFQQANMEIACGILKEVGDKLKKHGALLNITDRVACLDALCDTDVTGNGVAYYAGFDKNAGDDAVMTSNESKFEDGKPVLLPGGKIGKSSSYVPPDLTKFV